MSEKADPIVPHILYVADQRHPWQLAPIERLTVKYHTPTTVFVAFGTADFSVQPVAGRSGVSKQNYHVWCLLDDAAWERVQIERAAFQATLDALADGLRQLGRYAERLAQAGGVARAPNPLTPTAITAPDLDVAPSNWFTTHPVPRVERRVVVSHTPRMLRCRSNYDHNVQTPHNQRDHFVCPTDADWARIQVLHRAALDAEQRWEVLLRELGTYRDALADQRYAAQVERAGVQPSEDGPGQAAPDTGVVVMPEATPQTGVIETYRVEETDLDAELLGQLQAAGYRWTSARRTPDGRWHHLVSTSGNRGFRARRERLVSLVALASANRVEPAPAPPTIAGVVMMSAYEARSCVSRICSHLENARRELLELHDREGWKALGYESWRACAVAEFGTSSAHVYRLLSAAQIERELDSPIGESPESHLRPLVELATPEERREAWKLAKEQAGEERTARDVQQTVDELKQRAGVETTAQIREVKRRVRAVEGTYYGYDPQQGYRVGLQGKGAQYYQPDDVRRELERREAAGQTAEAHTAQDIAGQQEQRVQELSPLPATTDGPERNYDPLDRQGSAAEPIPIAVYAPSVTHLSAIRTALLTNDRAGAIRTTFELLGVLVGADLRAALHAAVAALDEEGRAGVADPLRRLVG